MAIQNLSPTPVLIGFPRILLASHLLQRLFLSAPRIFNSFSYRAFSCDENSQILSPTIRRIV